MLESSKHFTRFIYGILFLSILLTLIVLGKNESCETIDAFAKPEDGCIMRQEMKFINPSQFKDTECKNTFCLCERYPIKVLYYNHPPYIYLDKYDNQTKGILAGILRDAVSICCMGCVRILYSRPFNSPEEIQRFMKINSTFTIIMPYIAKINAKKYFKYPYIQMMATPGVVYITLNDDTEKYLRELAKSVLGTWPLVVTTFLMAVQAGAVIWVLDTWYNEDEFPNSFPRGFFEGIWWSFVTMTTVGYGDKSPRSYLARLFGIFWMLVGVAVSGLFTATLGSTLTQSLDDGPIVLSEKNVGMLGNKTRYEHGIALGEASIPKLYGNISELKAALEGREIEGILMDTFVAQFYWTELSSGLSIKARKGIPNSKTGYGAMLYTSAQTNITNQTKEWARFLPSYFEINEDNENFMVSAAIKKLPVKVMLAL